MKFRKLPVVIEAITFEELIQHGRDSGGNIVSGMPWSFTYKGHAISHEFDDCYLIPTKEGTMNFRPGDMLITGVQGEIYPCKKDIFDATYEDAEAPTPDNASEGAEVMIFLAVPEDQPSSVNVKFLPRDEVPNQDSPAIIVASYLNANMAELVVDAITTKREYDAAIAAGKTHEEAANAPALELAAVPTRSILGADGNIARRTDDVELIIPGGN